MLCPFSFILFIHTCFHIISKENLKITLTESEFKVVFAAWIVKGYFMTAKKDEWVLESYLQCIWMQNVYFEEETYFCKNLLKECLLLGFQIFLGELIGHIFQDV